MGKERAYHHGDLRATLLRLTIEKIAKEGVDKISVRALAREAGVAHRAAYQHFPDKDALVAAALSDGYAMLETRLAAVADETASPVERLIAIAKVLAVFAYDHQNMFLAMTGPRINQKGDFPELEAALGRNWRLVVAPIAQGVASGDFGIGDKNAAAAIFWGGLQGVITQSLLGRIKLDPSERDAFFETVGIRLVAALKP